VRHHICLKIELDVAVQTIYNQLPDIIKSSETIATFRMFEIGGLFYHKLLLVPCSNGDFPSLLMITPNDFVCCASELELS